MPRREDPWEALFTRFEERGGCWIWQGKILEPGMGYGLVSQHAQWHLAHRLSYETFVGDIPLGMQVLHRCDRPSCIRPDHLFLGTQQENIDDCAAKGRLPLGTDRYNAKLSAEIVKVIRELYNLIPIKALAAHAGVSVAHCRSVARGEKWRHVV